jgi:peroxidase
VDLWVGGLAEDHMPGAMVGPTFSIILRDQFERLRDGDRFWYESYLPADLLQTVRGQTLARIIRRNTTIGNDLQPNVFLVGRGR